MALVKKKEKLDVVFDWKPLYKIVNETYFSKYRKAVYTPKDHGSAIIELVRKIKRYFAPEATDEILNEFRPLLCVHDHLLFKAQGFLSVLLPTTTPRAIAWMDEMMTVWDWVGLYPTWDQSFMVLFGSLAEDQCGKIDWTPYLPFLFTRMLKACDVPIGNSVESLYDEYPMDECTLLVSFDYSKNLVLANCAQLIVWMIHGRAENENGASSATLSHLKKFLQSLASFYHPSNEGSWTSPLADFLLVLCSKFSKRIETENKKEGEYIPNEYRLAPTDCKEFVRIVLPIAMTAMYSKSVQMTTCANHSLKHLACKSNN
jgi:proteasome activator subunit 4